MPRNLFVPLAVVPMNVPLSSVTTGQVLSVEGEAKTVAVATQTGISNARRKTMSTREKDGQENHKGGRGVASREGRPQTLNWGAQTIETNAIIVCGVRGKYYTHIQPE